MIDWEGKDLLEGLSLKERVSMAGRSEVTLVKLSDDLMWEPACNLAVGRNGGSRRFSIRALGLL